MKIGLVAAVAIVASIVSSSAFAAMHDKRGTRITEVYINSTGAMLIQAEGIPGYLSLGSVGNKTAEVMYSTALAAKLSNHTNVWVRYWDATQGYPTVGIISAQ